LGCGGGLERCYNAQAAVAAGGLTNDKRQVASMLGKLGSLPGELGEIETLLANTG
jgi:hypothetical protein